MTPAELPDRDLALRALARAGRRASRCGALLTRDRVPAVSRARWRKRGPYAVAAGRGTRLGRAGGCARGSALLFPAPSSAGTRVALAPLRAGSDHGRRIRRGRVAGARWRAHGCSPFTGAGAAAAARDCCRRVVLDLGDSVFLSLRSLAIGVRAARWRRPSLGFVVGRRDAHALCVVARARRARPALLVGHLPWLARLHVFVTFATLAAFPLTRLAPLPIVALLGRFACRSGRRGGGGRARSRIRRRAARVAVARCRVPLGGAASRPPARATAAAAASGGWPRGPTPRRRAGRSRRKTGP